MNIVEFQNDTYNFPSSWDELTQDQLEVLAKLQIQGCSRSELLTKLALFIVGMRLAYKHQVIINGNYYYYVRHGITKIYLISPEQLSFLADSLSFLIDGSEIFPKLIRNPFKELHVKLFYRIFGPDDGLINITVDEFIQAEIERNIYEQTKNTLHFNRFLAILWRPTCIKHPDGDQRAPLKSDDIFKRAKKISSIAAHKKQVMLWFYLGCLNFLMTKFKDVFSSEEGELPSSSFLVDYFMKILTTLSKNDLSKVDNIRGKSLYDALYILQNIMEQNENNKPRNENSIQPS